METKSENFLKTLPPVDHVQGAVLKPGSTYRDSSVSLQYTDSKQEWHELSIPFLDAMYLLNILREMETSSGFGRLNKPPAVQTH